jgi:hypothetical protein
MINKPLTKKGLESFIKAAHSLTASTRQDDTCDIIHSSILGLSEPLKRGAFA